MSDEREQQILELLEHVTDDRRDAEARLMDEDLWAFLPPDLRPGLEALDVEEWKHAEGFFDGLKGLSNGVLPLVTSQLILNFHELAIEGLRRARERAEAA